MKNIFKKAAAVVLALAVMVTAFVFDAPAGTSVVAEAEGTVICDGDHNGWTPWTSTTSLPSVTNGRYYLTNDVTVTKETSHPSGLLYICLNGHTITATNNSRIFYNGAGFLYICDCEKSGKLTGGNPSSSSRDGNGGAIYVYAGGVDIYDVTLSGNTAKCGGAVYNYNGFFNIYGGTITNNTATESGGGVYSGFTLNGKVDISGNTTNGVPDNVYLSGSRTISIGDDFSTASSIGVSTAQTPTCSKAITGNCNSDISACFTADKSEQKIKFEDDKVWLYVDHNWGEWQTTAATCTKEGKKERSCKTSGCTEKETETITATGHDYENGKCKVCQAADPDFTPSGGENSGENNPGNNDNPGGNTGNTGSSGSSGSTSGSSSSGGSSSVSGSSSSSSSSSSSTRKPPVAEVELDGNAPETELATPDADLKDTILTEAELSDADDITFILRVKDIEPGADKQTIETRLASTDGFVAGRYLDASLFKIVNGSETKLTKTNKPIKIRIEIPEELRKAGRTFAVIRVHNGSPTILRDLDGDKDTITIETDKFSTYALIYSDSENPSTGAATAIFPITFLAAAAMLLSKKRR